MAGDGGLGLLVTLYPMGDFSSLHSKDGDASPITPAPVARGKKEMLLIAAENPFPDQPDEGARNSRQGFRQIIHRDFKKHGKVDL